MQHRTPDLTRRLDELEREVVRLRAERDAESHEDDGGAAVSRRGFFTKAGMVAVGAGAASFASVLNAAPAAATTGTMQYGALNFSGADQTVLNSTHAQSTLQVGNTGSTGDGIFATCSPGGQSGVRGFGVLTANGVRGESGGTGKGVWGISESGQGVLGESKGGNGYGVYGISQTSEGVRGVSTSGPGVAGQSQSSDGVRGSSSSGNGVHGRNDGATGIGVMGETVGVGSGVYGLATVNGVAVFGDAPATGTGVQARSTSGIALNVIGTARFSRSGTATIAGTTTVPKSSIFVGNVALTSKSLVLTTAQKNITGVWVRAAVPNIAGSSFTIYLNTTVMQSMPVAWMVVEKP